MSFFIKKEEVICNSRGIHSFVFYSLINKLTFAPIFITLSLANFSQLWNMKQTHPKQRTQIERKMSKGNQRSLWSTEHRALLINVEDKAADWRFLFENHQHVHTVTLAPCTHHADIINLKTWILTTSNSPEIIFHGSRSTNLTETRSASLCVELFMMNSRRDRRKGRPLISSHSKMSKWVSPRTRRERRKYFTILPVRKIRQSHHRRIGHETLSSLFWNVSKNEKRRLFTNEH